MFRLLLISLMLIACSTHAADELDALKQAAEQGHAKAQFILGMAFEKGQELSDTYRKAYSPVRGMQ